MKMKLTVLACAALFGLTACSSGGNSGVSYGGTIGGGGKCKTYASCTQPKSST